MIYLTEEGQKELPAETYFEVYTPSKGTKMALLGWDDNLKGHKGAKGVNIAVPKSLKKELLKKAAFTFTIRN